MKPLTYVHLCIATIIGFTALGCATGAEDTHANGSGGNGGDDRDVKTGDGSGGSDDGGDVDKPESNGGTGGEPKGNCGDGIVDPDEECDTNDLNSQSCLSLHFGDGTLACSNTCAFDTSGCSPCPAVNLGTWNSTPITKPAETTCDDTAMYDGNKCTEVSSEGKEQLYSITVPPHRTLTVDISTQPGFTASAWVSTVCADYDASHCVTGTSDASTNKVEFSNTSDAPVTYFIVVDGHSAESCGTFTISITDDVPTEWQCDPAHYNTGDGCDCGCGALDPDCANGDSKTCKTCDSEGSCAADCSDLETSKNWLCKPPPNCGDGNIDADEECDGSNLVSTACTSLGYVGGTLSCNAYCKHDTSNCHNCGNGKADVAEECDSLDLNGQSCETQGFNAGKLSCYTNCTFNTSNCTKCGNSLIEGDEQCDKEQLNGQTCANSGYSSGTLKCGSDCKLDYSSCFTCGNSIIEGDEQCDKTSLNSKTCITEGFDSGELACKSDCTFDTSDCKKCGNNKLEPGEECDTLQFGTQDCISMGYFGGSLTCKPDCTIDISTCNTCGNGTLEGTEECDSGNLNGKNCQSFGFDGGDLVCKNCEFDISPCSKCGDGIVGGHEQCDGENHNGQSCSSLGYSEGTLSCNSNCTLNTDACLSARLETLQGCESPYCTWAPAMGPNGGDLCSCTIQGINHPWKNNVSPTSPCANYGSGNDLIVKLPTGYTHFSTTTCLGSTANSSSAVFSTDPSVPGTNPLLCNGNSSTSMMSNGCSQLTDQVALSSGYPTPAALSGTGQHWLVVDEFNVGGYWDSATTRTFQFEMINNPAPSYFFNCAAGEVLRRYSNLTSATIWDKSTINRDITVADPGTVKKIAIMFSIYHWRMEDLEIRILRNGTSSTNNLFSYWGYSTNIKDTIIDSNCTASVSSGSGTMSNCYKPTPGNLNGFVGTAANTKWTFYLSNPGTDWGGTLYGWTLLMCVQP